MKRWRRCTRAPATRRFGSVPRPKAAITASASEGAAGDERHREHAVDEAAREKTPAETDDHGARARAGRREPRSEALQSRPDEAAGPLQRQDGGADAREIETEEDDQAVRHDQEDDLGGKDFLEEQAHSACPSRDRAGERIARDAAEAVAELPGKGGERSGGVGRQRAGLEIQGRDDSAAHGDAMHPTRETDQERGEDEGRQLAAILFLDLGRVNGRSTGLPRSSPAGWQRGRVLW